MKTFTLTGLFLFSLLILKAQEQQFGKASFIIPAGWQMTTATETVTLEKASKKGVTCKIIISASKPGAVTNTTQYQQYRTQHGGSGFTYQSQKGAVTKYEKDGLTSFFSKGITTQRMTTVHSYFYSLSNGSQTLYYQLLTNNNECISEFNQFMATLTMELEQPKQQAQARARKAAPAAPAAPAPMM